MWRAPPQVSVTLASEAEEHGRGQGAFLVLHRGKVRVGDAEPATYDWVGRRALDAVVVVAHHRAQGGERRTWLRSSVRPPLVLRDAPPFTNEGVLWEIPAGLIDPGEEPVAAAVRELREELGFVVDASSMHELGPWAYPAPGFVGERHVFFHVEVDPASRRAPEEEGPFEEGASIVEVSVAEALDAAKRGLLRDSKSELALRRLVELP